MAVGAAPEEPPASSEPAVVKVKKKEKRSPGADAGRLKRPPGAQPKRSRAVLVAYLILVLIIAVGLVKSFRSPAGKVKPARPGQPLPSRGATPGAPKPKPDGKGPSKKAPSTGPAKSKTPGPAGPSKKEPTKPGAPQPGAPKQGAPEAGAAEPGAPQPGQLESEDLKLVLAPAPEPKEEPPAAPTPKPPAEPSKRESSKPRWLFPRSKRDTAKTATTEPGAADKPAKDEPSKAAPSETQAPKAEPAKKEPSKWSFPFKKETAKPTTEPATTEPGAPDKGPAKKEPPKTDTTKPEPPTGEPPKADTTKPEPPTREPPKADTTKPAPPTREPPKADTTKPEPPATEPPKADTTKPEPPAAEPPKADTTKPEPPATEPPKADTKPEPPTTEPAKPDPSKKEPSKWLFPLGGKKETPKPGAETGTTETGGGGSADGPSKEEPSTPGGAPDGKQPGAPPSGGGEEPSKAPAKAPPPTMGKWGLPSLCQAESTLPPELQKAKEEIAARMQKNPLTHEDEKDYPELIEDVKQILFGDRRAPPEKWILKLVDVKYDKRGGSAGSSTREFLVKELIVRSSSYMQLVAVDQATGETLVVKLPALLCDEPLSQLESFKSEHHGALPREKKAFKALTHDTNAIDAQKLLGFVLPFAHAKVAGLSEITQGRDSLVYHKVQLFKPFWGDCADVRNLKPRLTVEQKAYLARNMLLQVLHMQERKVSHMDLKIPNFVMDPSGTPLLADFGSSICWGDKLPNVLNMTPDSTELEIVRTFINRGDIIATSHSDLWSLGLMLYDLFSDRRVPYKIPDDAEDGTPIVKALEDAMAKDVLPSTYKPVLEKRNTPERWQALIMRLLEIRRPRRITAEEIVTEFKDLYGGTN
ncbi:hypothetical protein Emed_003816 [Eimeria media]